MNKLKLYFVHYMHPEVISKLLIATMFLTLISATLITILSAFLQKSNKPVFVTLLFAAVFFVACIFISRFGNQPINKIIMTWTANSFPENWSILRDKWWSFHIMRTIAELLALFLVASSCTRTLNHLPGLAKTTPPRC